MKRMREVQFEAKHLLSDVDDKYLSLKTSLFKSVNTANSIENEGAQTNIGLIDLAEFIVPYLQIEYFSNCSIDEETSVLFDFEDSAVLSELNEFLFENSERYTEREQRIFLSTVLTAALQNEVVSHCERIWNPFDKEETVALVKFLKLYMELVYVESADSQNG